jgi:hypothetical protein
MAEEEEHRMFEGFLGWNHSPGRPGMDATQSAWHCIPRGIPSVPARG